MSALKVLTLCHNHPALHPGGTEIFAYDLFQAMKGHDQVQGLFVGCADDLHRERKPGTVFQSIGRSSDELLLWTGHFDRFFLSQIDLLGVAPEFAGLLTEWQPDIVHLHHTLMIGLEVIPLIRQVLPRARIVLTLHDYYGICANDGQMVTKTGSLCETASPDSCRRCFPEIAFGQFVLRENYVKTQLSQVDMFVAPSRFLADRYITWGLPAERLVVIGNGLNEGAPASHRMIEFGDQPDRFGFFGHINRFKGSLIALEAARLLTEQNQKFSLELNGGIDFQTDEFRASFEDALGRSGPSVRYRGGYARRDLPQLMAAADWVLVPSVWWENAPLVIQEAFQHGRPVICSDIGGMAEMVQDGVNGLHFRAGDPSDLARVMARAVSEPGLWERLMFGIKPPRSIDLATDEYLGLYHRLLEARLPAALAAE